MKRYKFTVEFDSKEDWDSWNIQYALEDFDGSGFFQSMFNIDVTEVVDDE